MDSNNFKNLFIDSTRKKTEELMGDDTPELSTNDHADEILLERDKDMCLKIFQNKNVKSSP